MTGLIVVLCVFVLLVAVLLLRVGVRVAYGESALVLAVRVGPWYAQLVPAKRRNGKKRPKPAKKKPAPKAKRETLNQIRALLPLILRTIKCVCGKLQVDKLDLVLTAAAKSPDEAAMQYGWANAVLGTLWQSIVDTCHVIDGRARVEIDFEAERPAIALQVELTIRLGQLLLLAIVFAVRALAIFARRARNTSPN